MGTTYNLVVDDITVATSHTRADNWRILVWMAGFVLFELALLAYVLLVRMKR